MELRDGAVSPWPIPPARTLLGIEASLLVSDVQELFDTMELAGHEAVSGPQLQWATHTEFPSVLKLLELNHSGWRRRRRRFYSSCKSGCQSGLGTSGRRRLLPTPRASWSDSLDERYSGVDEGCVLSTPGSAEEVHVGLSLPVAKVRGARRPPPSGAAIPHLRSGITTPNSRQHCCLTWKLSLARWCGSGPSMLGIPAASRKTSSPAVHTAWSRRRGQLHSSSG